MVDLELRVIGVVEFKVGSLILKISISGEFQSHKSYFETEEEEENFEQSLKRIFTLLLQTVSDSNLQLLFLKTNLQFVMMELKVSWQLVVVMTLA